MLEIQNVSKAFGPVRALSGINFSVRKGEIVGLVGENGAGKSTLMKIIFGACQADSGAILIDGRRVRFASPREAMAQGIGMVFQEQSLIGNLRIMENLFLGREHEFKRFGLIDFAKMAAASRLQLAKVGLAIDPYMETAKLSFAQRQLVELAKVLTLEERTDKDLVILLDEPTSVLSEDEVNLLFDLVDRLRRRAAFIFVSHRLDEVIRLSDRIYVLKDGEVADEVAGKKAAAPAIQSSMVGRKIDSHYYKQDERIPFDEATPILCLDAAAVAGRFDAVSLTLHAGEVLCLVGTEGAGREAILRAIFGMHSLDGGAITYFDNPQIVVKSPHDAVGQAIGYMPRERKIEGIFTTMNVAENMTSCQLPDYARFGLLNKRAEITLAERWIDKLSIKTPSAKTDCNRLSGGNQQKVVLAKWRSTGAQVMMLDHPTRGLDIGAKEDVYGMIRTMSKGGIGLIIIPDTLEEAIGLGHNIVVIKDGQVAGNFNCMQGQVTPLVLVSAMT